MKPLRYDEWVNSLFNQTISENGPHLHCEELWHTSSHFAELTIWLLQHCEVDLARFSDENVAWGLNYIFMGLDSEADRFLKSGEVSRAGKLELIRSFECLYLDCFESRCEPVLSHSDEAGGNLLNKVCYMLWDTSPLGYWSDHKDPEEFYCALIELHRTVLRLTNPACVESALHGLGHLHSVSPCSVESAIDEFIDRGKAGNLVEYAWSARGGYVL